MSDLSDMGFGPDSLVSVVTRHGVVRTDYVKNLRPAAVPKPSRWQRFVRRLTPKRFRKPLQPATPVERALALTAETLRLIERLTK